MYTLIIIAIGMHPMSGATHVSVDHVDGFTTEQRCESAAKLVKVNSTVSEVDTYCVLK
jgi:hypothetical protein